VLRNGADGAYGGIAGGLALDDTDLTVVHSVIAANNNGGLHLFSLDGGYVARISSTALAYNSGYNIDASSNVTLELAYSVVYDQSGTQGIITPTASSTYLAVEPGFLIYGSDGMPLDVHLALGSALIDAGDPAERDPDGSRADIGAYGGSEGAEMDLDGDGFPDWFWPGTIDQAPDGFDPADFDCDDLDPAVHGEG